MKNITSNYKQNVKLFGRQIDSKITYELDGETVELGAEELNSITPIYESQILKSVMKQLDIDSNVEIPIGTILTYQFGVKVGNSYEYTNYGNYIVKTIEKQEDLRSWKITCYDKMLYAMTDYESVGVTFPITIRNYINAIATHLNLTFKNVNDVFANYDKEIQNELYLDENGGSLGYTFRDVLDELAQVTASTICINEEDDELEIRYINELVNETSTATGTNLNINNKYASSKIDLELNGNTEQNEIVTGRQEIIISNENKSNSYEINLGKNLFIPFNFSKTNNGINFVYNGDGSISANGISTGNATSMFSTEATSYLITLQKGTYTISGNTTDIRLEVVNSNGTSLCNTGSTNNFTINTTTQIFIRANILSDKTIDNVKIYPQLERGSIATSYSAYKEPIELENSQDKIYKRNNTWYLYKGTETPITDLELIEQLNAVRLMAGINNISVSSSNLASPLKLTYATNCEEIDEEYLKDINVNFGEKFGPVNSIVLSRASESDNVYIRNEISVEIDGLCEIKIKDNQIMNFNDRSNYLPDILDKLYGLEYYINDFNSTGITYLDLCDKYYAKVFDNRYPCIMFNDEVDITQGLQETIHTEMPEESETDYKKADKTDRRINQAYIIVNKQEQTIEALTSSVETISQTENNNYLELLNKFQSLDENIADITEIENAVRQLQTNTYTKTEIQEIANGTAQDGTKVSTVITTSGTFDKDGLTIEQTTADTKTNINADGMIIYNKTGSTDDALLTVNSNGVITKNLKVSTYTELGSNSRFEDFVTDDYEDATAVFWIGS